MPNLGARSKKTDEIQKKDLTHFCVRSSVPTIWAIVYSTFQGELIPEPGWNEYCNQNEPTWRKGSAIGEFKDTSHGS
jgi:hypothetical protein